MNIEDYMKPENSFMVQFLSEEALEEYNKRQERMKRLFASIPQQDKENT